MEKIGLRIRSIGLKALVIGSCLILLTGNAAFANTAHDAPRSEIHHVAGAGSMPNDSMPEENPAKIDRTVISNPGAPMNGIAGESIITDSMITTMNGGTSEAAVLTVALHEPIHSTHSSTLLFSVSILVVAILLGGTAFIVRRVRNAHKEA